jgi:hypothetical protein
MISLSPVAQQLEPATRRRGRTIMVPTPQRPVTIIPPSKADVPSAKGIAAFSTKCGQRIPPKIPPLPDGELLWLVV